MVVAVEELPRVDAAAGPGRSSAKVVALGLATGNGESLAMATRAVFVPPEEAGDLDLNEANELSLERA